MLALRALPKRTAKDQRFLDALVEELEPPTQQATTPQISQEQIEESEQEAAKVVRERNAREKGVWVHSMEPLAAAHPGRDAHPRMTPKDVTSFGSEYHMQYRYEDPAGLDLIVSMATIASHEGMKVVVSAHKDDVTGLRGKLKDRGVIEFVSITSIDVQPSQWAEDSGEFFKGNAIGVNSAPPLDVEKGVFADREKRGYESKSTPHEWRFGDKPKPNPGRDIGSSVNAESKHVEKEAVAAATGRTVVPMRSYLEGGNVLAGTGLDDKPYALVGRDAVVLTKLLDKQQGEKESSAAEPTDDEVLALIAQDLGLDVGQVILVEQPGRFHLDVGMALIGNGVVILNDSRAVLETMTKWLKEDCDFAIQKLPTHDPAAITQAFEHIRAGVQAGLLHRASLEDMAARDLERSASGRFEVKRIPASFPATPFTPEMNFLNGETGTGPDQRSFFITNGGDARAEDLVSTAFFAVIERSKLARMYFADSGPSEISLSSNGGIGCRVKTAANEST